METRLKGETRTRLDVYEDEGKKEEREGAKKEDHGYSPVCVQEEWPNEGEIMQQRMQYRQLAEKFEIVRLWRVQRRSGKNN